MAKKVSERVEGEIEELGENLSVRLQDALESARDWTEVAQSFIKKNPGTSLAAAFFLGFTLSRVARHA